MGVSQHHCHMAAQGAHLQGCGSIRGRRLALSEQVPGQCADRLAGVGLPLWLGLLRGVGRQVRLRVDRLGDGLQALRL